MQHVTLIPLLASSTNDQYSIHYQLSTKNVTNTSDIWPNTFPTIKDCIVLNFDEFIPWNNPDNIVSFETEDLVRMLKDVVFLPILFLFGVPSNIINMIVFYKQGLKERINVCLFALALADGLFLIGSMILFGEQLQIRLTATQMSHGPAMMFMVNNKLMGLLAYTFVSQVLTAIIASERCFCILQPLRSQTVLRTSTMKAIIVIVNVILVGAYTIVTIRYHGGCVYNPITKTSMIMAVPGEFYLKHKKFLDYLNAIFFGAGLPGVVIVVVLATTIITTLKLRQAAAWRAGTSSSAGFSEQEIALTKMLVANSIFFILCVIPSAFVRISLLFMPEVNSGRRQHNLYMIMLWVMSICAYFNSTFNIVIYYTMGSRYRQIFWQLFTVSGKQKVTP